MAKTKPIGVRFDEETLDLIQKEQNLSSPQRVLNYLMDSYLKSNSLVAKQEDIIKTEQVVTEIIKVLKSPKNDKLGMPKGLSIDERIKWIENNKK